MMVQKKQLQYILQKNNIVLLSFYTIVILGCYTKAFRSPHFLVRARNVGKKKKVSSNELTFFLA